MTLRVLVVGAGAIGGVTAADLVRAGVDVVVLEADPAHARLIREPGLVVERAGRRTVVPMAVAERPEDLQGRFDVALVFLKAVHLESALPALARRDLVDVYVCFGNGLVQSKVRNMVGVDQLVVGIVEWGATRVAPGHVARTTDAPFVLGEMDGSRTDRVTRIASLLTPVAPVEVVDRIDARIWSKLILNCTFSGLGAASGLLYSEIAADPVGRDVAYRVWTEGCVVASHAVSGLDRVAGVDPMDLVMRSPADRATADIGLDALMKKLGPTKASMLQDLEAGRLTEVDVINGGVASVGAQLGVATPYNDALVRIIHEAELGKRTPHPDVFAELAAIDHLAPTQR